MRTPNASAVILAWHLQVACEHLVCAAELASILHPGTAYAGICRAAMALGAIATDPHAASDYGPTATADEALRELLGALLLGPSVPTDKAPPNPPRPMPTTTVEQGLVNGTLFDLSTSAPKVPQGPVP